MKTSLIIALFCASAVAVYAQSNDNQAAERQAIHERALAIYCQTNGNMGPATEMRYNNSYYTVHNAYPNAPANAVPAKPSGYYTALQDPPCYKYKDSKGHEVMECPGARFTPPQCSNTESAKNEITANGNSAFSAEKSYSGYYPDLHALYPNAPTNAQPAWPAATEHYTELQNPPCYKYINKRGLEIMECPGAQFEPEHVYR